MKYGIERTINLGRYGREYESIKLLIEDADSFSEAELEIKKEFEKIHKAMTPLAQARLAELTAKDKLTIKENNEREELKKISFQPPF